MTSEALIGFDWFCIDIALGNFWKSDNNKRTMFVVLGDPPMIIGETTQCRIWGYLWWWKSSNVSTKTTPNVIEVQRNFGRMATHCQAKLSLTFGQILSGMFYINWTLNHANKVTHSKIIGLKRVSVEWALKWCSENIFFMRKWDIWHCGKMLAGTRDNKFKILEVTENLGCLATLHVS